MISSRRASSVLFVLLYAVWNTSAFPADPQVPSTHSTPTSVAVVEFDNQDALGFHTVPPSVLVDFLSAELSRDEGLHVVERGQIDRVLDEQALTLTGTSGDPSVSRVGNLLGAQVLIHVRAFRLRDRIYASAKLIRTDTGTITAIVSEGPVDQSPLDLVGGVSDAISRKLREQTTGTVDADENIFQRTPTPTRSGDQDDRSAQQHGGLLLLATATGPGHVETSDVESALSYELLERGLRVHPLPEESLRKWRQLRDNGRPPTAALFEAAEAPVDRALFVTATFATGPRTGELITVRVDLHLTVYSPVTGRVTLTRRFKERAHDVTVSAAAMAALREVALPLAVAVSEDRE